MLVSPSALATKPALFNSVRHLVVRAPIKSARHIVLPANRLFNSKGFKKKSGIGR